MGPNLNTDKEYTDAEHGDAIVISYKGYSLEEEEYNDPSLFFLQEKNRTKKVPFVDCQNQIIILGDGDITPGLELGCRFLKRNQSAWIRCHSKYGYSASTRRATTNTTKNVTPFTSLAYHVYIQMIIPASDTLFSSPDFQIIISHSKKQIGNDVYVNEWDDENGNNGGSGRLKSLKLYGNGADRMINLLKEIRDKKENNINDEKQNDDDGDKKVEAKALPVLLDCLNNISAVHYKSKDYGLAKEAATAVLQWDVTNQKALCRAAKSALLDPAGSFEESEMAILAAEKLYPNESQVQSLRKFLIQKKKQHKEREKAMYGGKIKNISSKNNPSVVNNNTSTTNVIDKATHTGTISSSEKVKPFGISTLHFILSIIIMVAVTYVIGEKMGYTILPFFKS